MREGAADLGMLPCENTLAGRVPDMHHLLPESGLTIIGEAFQRVEHCLLAAKGATLATLKRAHSHAVALGQVRKILRELKLQAVVEADTAGVRGAGRQDGTIPRSAPSPPRWRPTCTAWKSCAPTSRMPPTTPRASTSWPAQARPVSPDTPGLMTTFVFRVRNVPAALYKALGGFATNGVNMTKLESYMLGGQFTATQFLCDVDGHPEQPALRRALEELSFFSRETRILGVYPAAAFRRDQESGD